MKKLFKFALVAFAAAAVMVACQPASQPTTPDKPDTPDTPDTPDKPDTPDEVVPVEGTSEWSLIGALLGKEWNTDWVAAKDGDIYVIKNVKLTTADQFKLRKDKAWTENRGAIGDVEPFVMNAGEAIEVVHNGKNMSVAADGIYDIYYNAAVEQIAVVAKDAQPTWKEVTPDPVASNWDFVLDMSNYQVNARIPFSNALTINTGHLTMQWKFYANEWNNYDTNVERNGETYKVWANRLGQLYDGDYGGEGILLRFGDGHKSGSLRLNGGAIIGDAYVQANGDDYIWETAKWHVLSLVADGTNVTVYDNDAQVCQIAQSSAAHDWTFGAIDLSETMDDGDVAYCKGQAFQGYTAYIRMWDKALSTEEIAASLCDVDAKSEGLKAYWKFNLDEGSTVKDEAGANDINFKNIKAAANAEGGKVTDNSQAIEGAWTSVEGIAPVCAE